MRKLLPILILTVFSFLSAIKVQAQCIPATSCTFPDIITNVTFARITNVSMRRSRRRRPELLGQPSRNCNTGAAYTLSISTGGDVEGVAAWIDYNLNNAFEASESLFTPEYLNANPATYTFSVLIPAGATPGHQN